MDEERSLRARVAALEAENARLRAVGPAGPAPAPAPDGAGPGARPRRRPGRALAAVALLVVGALLVPAAVVGSWGRGLLTDTDRYLETVAPLVEDPAVQSAVVERVTTAVVEAAELSDRVDALADALAGLDLPPLVVTTLDSLRGPAVDAVTSLVRSTVDRVVGSPAFADAWREANRAAHDQLLAVAQGDPDAIAQLEPDGSLSIQLGTVVDAVRDRLVAGGFTLVERLPSVDVSFPLLSSAEVTAFRQAYTAVDLAGTWLPWIALALLAGGVLAARNRARTVVTAGALLSAGALAVALAVAAGRTVYLNAVSAAVRRPDAALAVYDQLTVLLRATARATLAVGVVALLAGLVTGRSAAAGGLRSGTGGLLRRVADLGGRHGLGTGRAGGWVADHRVLLRTAVALAAVAWLVALDRITPTAVAVVAGCAVLALLLIELVAAGRSPTEPAEEQGPAPQRPSA